MDLHLLNKEQKIAVEHQKGPLLVLSGAGTGKTRVLTSRFVYIVKNLNVNFHKIIAVTFTNKAANEIKERVNRDLGQFIDSPWIGTFHSIFAKFLRKHSNLIGLKNNFNILDTDDQKKLIKQVINFCKFENDVNESIYLNEIQNLKDQKILPSQKSLITKYSSIENIVDIYELYQQRLLEINAVDFGDILLHSYQILFTNEDLRQLYAKNIEHILIDEFQDTNHIQYELIKLLLNNNRNLFCVGDDDQSIYAWRGAKIENIINFPNEFSCSVVRLTKNYRSNHSILNAASSIINNNQNRLGKELISFNDDIPEQKINLKSFYSQEEESLWIADSISRKFKENDTFGVLVRLTAQMRSIEDKFIKYALPYEIIGGPRFFERKEIKDVLCYLKLANSFQDDLAFERIINLPRRGIGEQSLKIIIDNARENKISFFESLKELLKENKLASSLTLKTHPFVDLIIKINGLINKTSLEDLGIYVIEESGYLKMLENEKNKLKKIENESRIDNLKELANALAEFENLDNFLEHVGLVNENQKKIHHNSVKLMTLHAAKGLEFDHVYLPGWEEGIFPSSRALDQNSSKALEEERRLAYVGITRAKFDLNLSYASSRYTYGINNYSLPSRFLSEISDIEIDKSSILEDYKSNRENKLTSINDKDLSPGKKRMLEFLNKHKK
ncbi:UvrD-helicase domain-containing protein [Alphaproteobacteria bacterium]|nr:UvrD-helicase domain-containing protein [Alphaproteobacteria bacterium]